MAAENPGTSPSYLTFIDEKIMKLKEKYACDGSASDESASDGINNITSPIRMEQADKTPDASIPNGTFYFCTLDSAYNFDFFSLELIN